MSSEGWRLLRPGAGPGLLAVDFTPAQARTGAGFTDLARLLPEPYPVWGTEEAGWKTVAAASVDSPGGGLDAWLDRDLPASGGTAGILGYCAGAALACALARRLADRHGIAPPVVLFDPAEVTPETLYDQFGTALDGLAAALPAAEVRSAREAARRDVRTESDLSRLAARLSDRYAALARPACAGQGVPPSIADQLCARIDTYLRYLLLSAAAPAGAPGPVLVVLSAGHEPPPIPGADREVRLEVPQPGLLADVRAAELAGRALVGEPLGGRS
ncbi:hypothetical protein ABNF97_30325 [Plantactinospora sp. B6F1]|uniref:hypothetical protein n=1 Tax=Plantactinospora sp. B6F1 TaxID=3158971 RepID=UPI0032D969D5